jgi:SAM-dependent methyltransferase
VARAAQAGQQVTDCDPGEFAAGGFGPAGYPDAGSLPEGAVRVSLGCGNPVAVADLRPGETVLDLGCGGGVDVLLSARRAGPAGKVYGLDMTTEMLDLARAHARQAGAGNAEFLLGLIEAIPLPDASVDVIISNCVINLSADRTAVFAESFRLLRPGGRLGVTDILAEDRLTPAERLERGGQAGCIAGARRSPSTAAAWPRRASPPSPSPRRTPLITVRHLLAWAAAGRPQGYGWRWQV